MGAAGIPPCGASLLPARLLGDRGVSGGKAAVLEGAAKGAEEGEKGNWGEEGIERGGGGEED